jgi:hypothetical protein
MTVQRSRGEEQRSRGVKEMRRERMREDSASNGKSDHPKKKAEAQTEMGNTL